MKQAVSQRTTVRGNFEPARLRVRGECNTWFQKMNTVSAHGLGDSRAETQKSPPLDEREIPASSRRAQIPRAKAREFEIKGDGNFGAPSMAALAF